MKALESIKKEDVKKELLDRLGTVSQKQFKLNALVSVSDLLKDIAYTENGIYTEFEEIAYLLDEMITIINSDTLGY